MCTNPFFRDPRPNLPPSYPKPIATLLDNITPHLQSGCYNAARYHLDYGLKHLPKNINKNDIYLLFTQHIIELRDEKFKNAVKLLDFMWKLYPHHILLCDYLVTISESVLKQSQDEYLSFFLSLTQKSQREILQTAIYYLDRNEKYFPAIRLCILLIKAFPEISNIWGEIAIMLIHKSETKYKPVSTINIFRTLLALDILPLLYSIPVKLVTHDTSHTIPYPNLDIMINTFTSESRLQNPNPNTITKTHLDTHLSSPSQHLPDVQLTLKAMDSSFPTNKQSREFVHFPISKVTNLETSSKPSMKININLFILGIEKAAAFHLARKDWRRLFELFLATYDICGFACNEETDNISDPITKPNEFFKEIFQLHKFRKILDKLAMPCMTSCACLAAIEYNNCIMGKSDSNGPYYLPITTISKIREKKRKRSSNRGKGFLEIPSSSQSNMTTFAESVRDVMKVTNLINPEPARMSGLPTFIESTTSTYSKISKPNRNIPLKSFHNTIPPLLEAQKWLDRLHECVMYMESNWPQHHQIFNSYMDIFQPPFEIHNSILLARGDLAFMNGQFEMAISFYQLLQERIIKAWESFRESTTQYDIDMNPLKNPTSCEMTNTDMDPRDIAHNSHKSNVENEMEKLQLHDDRSKTFTSIILPFTILYRIALTSTKSELSNIDPKSELLLILSTLPHEKLTWMDFEKDQEIIRNTNISNTKLGFIKTNSNSLATRSLKLLMYHIIPQQDENEINKRIMNIDFDSILLSSLRNVLNVQDPVVKKLSRSTFQEIVEGICWKVAQQREHDYDPFMEIQEEYTLKRNTHEFIFNENLKMNRCD